jgi:hypothetical protein
MNGRTGLSVLALLLAILVSGCGEEGSDAPAVEADTPAATMAATTPVAPSSAPPTQDRSPSSTEGLNRANYEAAYTVCSSNPARIYEQSSTNDPVEAAEWLSEAFREGTPRLSTFRGCLDALLERPNRFGD